jgi:hypothetical protein
MMSLDPSVLPWWGWVLSAVVLACVAVIGFAFFDDLEQKTDWSVILFWLAVGAVPAALFCLAVGLIRFIKWAWTG